MITSKENQRSGFALLITLLLLALLTLAVFSLSALVKVNSGMASAATARARARQNALLGLNVGLGELQRMAGSDGVVTAMAGVTGVGANATNSQRHWCGVWSETGAFQGWLSSGALITHTPQIAAGTHSVEMVGSGSVGAADSNSEHVSVGKIPIIVTEVPGSSGADHIVGSYAFWVGDEGVKISAYSPGASIAPVLGSAPSTSAPAKLRLALAAHASGLPKISSYEQLAVLPTPGAALTPAILQDCFHHTTLTARHVDPDGAFRTGATNVNTSSALVWRGVLETYNSASGALPKFSSAKITSASNALAIGIAAANSGKNPEAPFTSVAAFMGSTLLSSAIASPTGVTVADFEAVMAGILVTRSDTFRIRGYGESINPMLDDRVEASAMCEAIVQRTAEAMPGNLGRRFRVIHFRWLLPSDI